MITTPKLILAGFHTGFYAWGGGGGGGGGALLGIVKVCETELDHEAFIDAFV